jgi:hypothetical protein
MIKNKFELSVIDKYDDKFPIQPAQGRIQAPLRDVHVYDGKILIKFEPKTIYSKDNENQLFESLKKYLTNPRARAMVDLFINQDVMDVSNNINPRALLFNILSYHLNTHIINLLNEQLEDAYLFGQCPQGRVHRMFQIYSIIIDNPDEFVYRY